MITAADGEIELNKQKDQLERIFASSPNGIIAVDAMGNVTSFNKQAEDILGYRADEVVGKPVNDLYLDPKEPRNIGKMLYLSADGRVANYETSLKSKDGRKIPIRHSLTWLYDSNGKRIGSVGYFEDLRPAKERKRRIELLLKANNIVAQAENMDDGLKSLAEMMGALLDTTFCRIFLLDESNRFLVAKAVSLNPSYGAELDWNPGLGEQTAVAEWEGLSDALAKRGPFVLRIGGRQGHLVLEEWSRRLGLKKEIQSLLVTPLRTRNRVVGLLDVGELRCWEEAPFSEEKIDLAAAIAYQIAVLVDRIRLHEITERRSQLLRSSYEELEQLSRAAQTMSKVSTLKQTLRTIVKEAVKMFEADFSTIWPYDPVKGQFFPEELEAIGYSQQELQVFEPEPEGWTYTALQEGWVSAPDISNSVLTESKREILKRYGVASFQAIALRVGADPIGVLYVSYKQPRTFGEEDRRSLESFAAHAALSLRNAKLLDQVSKAKTAAMAVARMTALGDPNKTLNSITKETKEAVRCDAVVLYVYDQATNKLDHPPTMVGVRYEDRAMRYGEVLSDSLAYKMLKRDKPRIVEKIAEDPLFRNSRFALDEGIESCVAIPLKAAEQKVGVMFVNYRAPHRFTSEEGADIELFADQAAVAIRNAQLFEDARQLPEQKALVNLSKKLLGAVKRQEVLDIAVKFAAKALDTDMSNIVLPDRDGNLIFAAAIGWQHTTIGESRMGSGGESQTGYTVKEKKPVVVDDYDKEERFTVPSIVFKNEIKSGLSVPMFDRGEVVGAMLVHSRQPHHFTEAETTLLSLIANQTAIALKSARQYEAIERKSAYLNALYEAGKAITRSFALEPKQILDCIVQQAVECVIDNREEAIGFGVIYRYKEAKDELICESAYPLQGLPNLSDRIGQRRYLGKGRIGVTGRTVKTRQPQLVRDVGNDTDYVEFDPRVKSQLTAPLLDQDKVIGVIGLESEETEAFDKDTQNTLQALAELAVITIRNSEQYKELREIKGLVGSRTALAWTGMISSAWRHTIEMHAITIREEVQLLRSEFTRSQEPERIVERLAKIERLANRILEKPITPPLSIGEAHSVSINALIRDRTKQLWNNDPYKSVKLDLKLDLANSATMRASLEWLRRCLDVLIDNAVEAMLGRSDRRIIIASRESEEKAEISVTDNGKGIPVEVAAQLFREPVKKLKGAKGLGIGLLFAQTIVQTYGGDLRCDSTGPMGTTMTISLPLET